MATEPTIELSEEDLLSDDLLPNTGGSEVFLVEPDEEVMQEASDERAMMSGAAPLFTYLLNWFDQEIDDAGHIDSINVESKVDVTAQIIAQQRLGSLLSDMRARLVAMRDEHIK